MKNKNRSQTINRTQINRVIGQSPYYTTTRRLPVLLENIDYESGSKLRGNKACEHFRFSASYPCVNLSGFRPYPSLVAPLESMVDGLFVGSPFEILRQYSSSQVSLLEISPTEVFDYLIGRQKTDPNLWIFFSELKESVNLIQAIGTALRSTPKLLRNKPLTTDGEKALSRYVRNTSTGKKAADAALAERFGLTPFLSDILKMQKILDSLNAGWKRLREQEGKPVIIRRSDERVFQHAITVPSFKSTWVINMTVRIVRHSQVSATYSLNGDFGPLQFALSRLNLAPTMANSWSLLPLSFIVDWFLPVKKALTLFDPYSLSLDWSARYLARSVKVYIDWNTSCVEDKYSTEGLIKGMSESNGLFRYYTRTSDSPYNFNLGELFKTKEPGFYDTAGKLSTGIALLRSRISK